MEKLYTWKLIRKIQRIWIRCLYVHHPPPTCRTSNCPPPVALTDNCPIPHNYSDEFILNMKVVQNGSTNTDTLSICLSDVHDTSGMEPSPSGCTSGNHPELAVHPRMNSHSEHSTLYCVRAPLTLHTSCLASVCYDCFVFTVFIPPYLR